MSEAKFTPGPWHVGPVDDTRVEDSYGNEVAQIDGDYNHPDTWPIMEANAHLIAAAPDLYEALETLMEEYSKVIREYKGLDVGSCGDVAYDVAGVALARSRGES